MARKHECGCGGNGVRKKAGSWVCKRCDAIERAMWPERDREGRQISVVINRNPNRK